jgi:viroplasmin and RNaseH domain-containing protein
MVEYNYNSVINLTSETLSKIIAIAIIFLKDFRHTIVEKKTNKREKPQRIKIKAQMECLYSSIFFIIVRLRVRIWFSAIIYF